jgi:hypothetical protein
MRRSLALSIAIVLSCLAAATGAFFAGRAGGPNLVIAARAGSLAGSRSGAQAGSVAGQRAGYRIGYSAGYRRGYSAAYRLAFQRALGR